MITLENLKVVGEAYEKNFKALIKTVGTPAHRKYSAIEKRLDRQDVRIRKELGIYAPDPCPITRPSAECMNCTGFFKSISLTTKKGGIRTVVIESKEKTKDFCDIKAFMNGA